MVAAEVAAAALGAGASGLNNLLNIGASAYFSGKSYKRAVSLWKMQADWQERMANTAHQREVQDLRKAGLNPILSATGGSGAPTGSVGMPTADTFNPDIDEGALTSALAIRQQKNQNKLADSQVSLNEQTGKKAESDSILNSAIAEKTRQDKLNSIDLTKAEIELKREQMENLKEERKYIGPGYEVAKQNARSNAISAGASSTSAGATLADVKNKIESDAYGSPLGKVYNSAKKIYRDFTTSNKYGRAIKKGINLYNKYAPGIHQFVK